MIFLKIVVASEFHFTKPTIHDFLVDLGFFKKKKNYSLEKEIGESQQSLLKVLLFKTMSTSPDSNGLAKGFMAWQQTFFFFQKLILFVLMWIK